MSEHWWRAKSAEHIAVTLTRGQWWVIVEAAASYDKRVPVEQGDGGAGLDAIRKAIGGGER